MGTVVGAGARDPWLAGYPVLAVVLGCAIGWQSLSTWLATGCVLAAVGLGIWRPATATVWAGALGLLVLTATAAGGLTGERQLESAALASAAALAHAAVISLPVGVVALARRRREHRRQGWELARALAAEERARAESALVRERAAMAGEIHDHLGHRLTLLTVQVGQLTLDPDLAPGARDALGQVRGGLAEAAGELGETVQLLKAGGMPTREPADRSPSAVVRQARDAGLTIEGDLPPALEDDLSPHARSAVVRTLSEALTNAAKHAPGEPVHLEAAVSDGVVTMTVRNAVGDPRRPAVASSGHGLRSLRHRLSLLGGRLEVEQGTDLVLRATVPVDAAPGPDHTADPVEELVRTQRSADERTRRTRRLAWLVPAGLAAAALLLTAGFYLYLTVASTLSPEDFARVEVGMPQSRAEELLPSVEMVEAPRDALPVPAGATCRYHEDSVSLFAREDVFRVCFADGVVVSTDRIPAPRGAR